MAAIKVSSKVEADVWEDLKELADDSHQNISGLLTEAIREYLQRRRAPLPTHRAVPVAEEESRVRDQRQAEKGMERHGGEQQDEPQRIRRLIPDRVDTHESRDEQVAHDQEVHDHPFVPDVVAHVWWFAELSAIGNC